MTRYGGLALLAVLTAAFVTSAHAQQRTAIHAETASREEFRTLATLIAATDMVGPDGVSPRSDSAGKIEAAKRLVITGEAGDFAATFLSLRQIPFVGPAGEDYIAEFSARMMQIAQTAADPTSRMFVYCPQSGGCNMDAITRAEIRLAIGAGVGEPPLSSMQPNRGLPITRPVAAITGFLDAQMNTARYLPMKPNGQRMTVAEAVADLQTRHSAAETNEMLASCLANENTYSIAQCAIAGARAGLAFNNESGVRYSGSRFLGVTRP